MIENIGVVIPVGAGRIDNLKRLLTCLNEQVTGVLHSVVIVCDGPEASREVSEGLAAYGPGMHILHVPKHAPGMEQPRNLGVRKLQQINERLKSDGEDEMTHVWFLDSDLVLSQDALWEFQNVSANLPAEAVICGPYDWLPPGMEEPMEQLHNDPRWPSFNEHDGEFRTNDLSAGLACFSGNLIWPISEFSRIGGFWKEIHHGRCEDGELGLRAVACGVPIAFAAKARGWHVEHDRNIDWIIRANERDVPMLNARHPWVEGAGMFVVEEDGKRFDVECPCGWQGNTALIWEHEESCPLGYRATVLLQS